MSPESVTALSGIAVAIVGSAATVVTVVLQRGIKAVQGQVNGQLTSLLKLQAEKDAEILKLSVENARLEERMKSGERPPSGVT